MVSFFYLLQVCTASLLSTTSASATHTHTVSKTVFGIEQIKQSIHQAKGTPIMSYKEFQRDWCEAKTFFQTIKHRNCLDVVIQNKYCYGQCNSLYIPGLKPLRSCKKCLPAKYEWVVITMRCPNRKKRNFRRKKIQKVYSCSCSAC